MKSMSVEFWTLVLVSLRAQTRKTWGSLKILKKNYIAIVDIDIVDIDIGKTFLDFVASSWLNLLLQLSINFFVVQIAKNLGSASSSSSWMS